MADRYYTTPGGRRRLVERIERVRAEYQTVVDSNEEANEAGDSSVWHDNFAYEENQRQMHQLARRVRDLESLLAEISVVKPKAEPQSVVLGSAVVVSENGGAERRYVIGGYEDGDPSVGRISYTAPLARVLIGAEPGEVRELHVDGGARELEVVALERAEEGEV
ncbi:MAG: GreA/GreB family elongation factor [Armatimonadota bacterium]